MRRLKFNQPGTHAGHHDTTCDNGGDGVSGFAPIASANAEVNSNLSDVGSPQVNQASPTMRISGGGST